MNEGRDRCRVECRRSFEWAEAGKGGLVLLPLGGEQDPVVAGASDLLSSREKGMIPPERVCRPGQIKWASRCS